MVMVEISNMAHPRKPHRSLRHPAASDGLKVALGAAAVGAAAAAGKVGLEKVREDGSGGSGGPSRKYRLRDKESLGEGMRRIALGRIDHALDELRGGADDRAAAVHEARKDLKKLRAVVRLVRDEIGDELYREQNARFRDLGRKLSGARDAQVRLETLDELIEQTRLEPGSVSGLCDGLESERARQAEIASDELLEGVAAELDAEREEIASWPVEGEDWNIVGPGLKRIYRRGRNRFEDVVVEPSTENLHEWRKRAKDLWYGFRILRPAWTPVMEDYTDAADRLSDLLGDDHDLAVLAATARDRAGAFNGDGLEQLLEAVGERRAELQSEAIPMGRRLYAEKPGAFADRIESWWRAWRGISPVTVS
jgi:CHAD domain-containing protein